VPDLLDVRCTRRHRVIGIYLGAGDSNGPSRTGQPAVDSYYHPAMQPEPISTAEYESQLNQLHERREELEEAETTLTSHDHGGGLPADDQNRLERVRGQLADVLQQIGDLKDRYADAGNAKPDPDGALGE